MAGKVKKKKSQAPVALVYFLSLLIFLLIFGFIGLKVTQKFQPVDEKGEVRDTEEKINNFSILFARVTNDNELGDLCVLRVVPEDNKVAIIPLSAYTVSQSSNSVFRDIYSSSGISKLHEEVQKTLKVSIDYYVTLSNLNFESLISTFGSISYVPKQELYHLSDEDDSEDEDIFYQKDRQVLLDGRNIRAILQTADLFDDGFNGNMIFHGTIVTAVVNDAFQQENVTKNNIDKMYNIMTENENNNYKKKFFISNRTALNKMLGSSSKVKAANITPKGEWRKENEFVISSATLNEVAEYFRDALAN